MRVRVTQTITSYVLHAHYARGCKAFCLKIKRYRALLLLRRGILLNALRSYYSRLLLNIATYKTSTDTGTPSDSIIHGCERANPQRWLCSFSPRTLIHQETLADELLLLQPQQPTYLWQHAVGFHLHPSIPSLPVDAHVADVATGSG